MLAEAVKTFGQLTFVELGKKNILFPSHLLKQPFDPVWKCPDAPNFHKCPDFAI